jgi:hypothetical protein
MRLISSILFIILISTPLMACDHPSPLKQPAQPRISLVVKQKKADTSILLKCLDFKTSVRFNLCASLHLVLSIK